MQWIYIICFALISAGLLALFGVRPGDFIDALFRSQRKAATLSDELNVLMGTPAKGFFNQDYELKQILKGTGRSDRYEAVKRLSLILFAVGAVLALLINNVYMVPILGIGFSLAPIWYLRSTAASYKKHLNEELETAISIITTSYLRTEVMLLPAETIHELTGEEVEPAECSAVLSRRSFDAAFSKYIEWHTPDPSACTLRQLCLDLSCSQNS